MTPSVHLDTGTVTGSGGPAPSSHQVGQFRGDVANGRVTLPTGHSLKVIAD